MRAFIAIPLPDDVKDYLYNLEKEISKLPAKFRLISKKNLHLTMKFIQDASEEQIEEIKSRLKTIKFNSIKTALKEKGLFPDEKKARIIWIDIEQESRVIELQRKIDEKLIDLFSDNQEFKSHITLGRIKFVKNIQKFIDGMQVIKIKKIPFEINKFGLYKSTLTKDGPVYELIEEYKMN